MGCVSLVVIAWLRVPTPTAEVYHLFLVSMTVTSGKLLQCHGVDEDRLREVKGITDFKEYATELRQFPRVCKVVVDVHILSDNLPDAMLLDEAQQRVSEGFVLLVVVTSHTLSEIPCASLRHTEITCVGGDVEGQDLFFGQLFFVLAVYVH